MLHTCLITVLALFWVAQPKGTGGAPDRPVGVAVVYESAAGEEYFTGEAAGGGPQAESSEESLEAALPAMDALPSTAEALSAIQPGATTAGGAAGEAVGDLGLGDGGTDLGTNRDIPKAKTTVFGIEGEGTRFLYVFDRSDSMNGYEGAPFRAAKSQLLKSLESLGLAHQFQIIFYNDTPLPYGGLSAGQPRILTGEEKDKRDAQRFVRNVVAVGGTNHIDALRMAINMSPDVVFFLTDAEKAPNQRNIDRLLISASRVGATVHTIQFGRGANQLGGGWIQFLAENSGGKYRYIDVTKLDETTF